MSSSVLSFYIISFFILGGGLLAVTSRKIFRSAVWLLFSLTAIAALYFWMDLQFLAAVQIIVYIGGIVVLPGSELLGHRRGARQAPASRPNGSTPT